MRTMRLHAIGGTLALDEVAPPEPGPGEVAIDVAAVSLNFADTLMLQGRYQEKPALPFAPGIELAGRVATLGPRVAGPPPGTRVAAVCGHGGLAERVVVPAAAALPVPDAMPDADAAALQVAHGTGHVALWHRAGLKPGERLLVLGAAGGVGLSAVEIGALMGAEVIAVARGAERLEAARAAGARHLIDGAEVEASPGALKARVRALGGADVVYDPVGGALWVEAMGAANPEARLIPIGFASGEVPQIPANILLVKNLTVIGLYWGAYERFRPEVLAESFRALVAWYLEGRLRPQIGHRLPLERAGEGLALLAERRATGKVIVEIGPAGGA